MVSDQLRTLASDTAIQITTKLGHEQEVAANEFVFETLKGLLEQAGRIALAEAVGVMPDRIPVGAANLYAIRFPFPKQHTEIDYIAIHGTLFREVIRTSYMVDGYEIVTLYVDCRVSMAKLRETMTYAIELRRCTLEKWIEIKRDWIP